MIYRLILIILHRMYIGDEQKDDDDVDDKLLNYCN